MFRIIAGDRGSTLAGVPWWLILSVVALALIVWAVLEWREK